jgi:hypothetical protein
MMRNRTFPSAPAQRSDSARSTSDTLVYAPVDEGTTS